jgi:quercetin dioxygenase-like cupin family protein
MNMKPLKLALQFGAATAATLGLAAAAHAGDCPASAMRPDARAPGETMPKGVTDKVLSSIELGDQIGVNGRSLRLRRLVIQPGGVVPWHTHTGRPALIITVSGSVTEYRSTCAVPIEHPAGDVAREVNGTSHWWRNNTNSPTVLLSADVKADDLPPAADRM